MHLAQLLALGKPLSILLAGVLLRQLLLIKYNSAHHRTVTKPPFPPLPAALPHTGPVWPPAVPPGPDE
jgi:hypothetical protein